MAGHVVYARHVADHEIFLVAEVASAPALVNCRVSSPSLPVPSIPYMEYLWSSHNLATAYPYLLISSCIFTIANRWWHTRLVHLRHMAYQ